MGKDFKKINFRCVYCGNIYGSIKGICAHVVHKHKKKFNSSCYEFTSQQALPLAYGRSRTKTALRKEVKCRKLCPNFMCCHCGNVYNSRLAMAAHIKGAHKKTMTIKDYTRTSKPAIISKRGKK